MTPDLEKGQLSDSFSKVSAFMDALLELLVRSRQQSLELAEKFSTDSLRAARQDDAVIIGHIRQVVLVMREQQKLIVQQKDAITCLEKRLAAVEAEFAPKRLLLGKELKP